MNLIAYLTMDLTVCLLQTCNDFQNHYGENVKGTIDMWKLSSMCSCAQNELRIPGLKSRRKTRGKKSSKGKNSKEKKKKKKTKKTM